MHTGAEEATRLGIRITERTFLFGALSTEVSSLTLKQRNIQARRLCRHFSRRQPRLHLFHPELAAVQHVVRPSLCDPAFLRLSTKHHCRRCSLLLDRNGHGLQPVDQRRPAVEYVSCVVSFLPRWQTTD